MCCCFRVWVSSYFTHRDNIVSNYIFRYETVRSVFATSVRFNNKSTFTKLTHDCRITIRFISPSSVSRQRSRYVKIRLFRFRNRNVRKSSRSLTCSDSKKPCLPRGPAGRRKWLFYQWRCSREFFKEIMYTIFLLWWNTCIYILNLKYWKNIGTIYFENEIYKI